MSVSSPASAGLAAKKRLLVEKLLRKEGIEADTGRRIPRRRGQGAVPLSFAQQRLWFLHHLEPLSSAYHLAEAVRLHGPLRVAALAAALEGTVRRHEVLSATFSSGPNGPVQRFAPALAVPLPVADLRGLPAAEREAVARALVGERFAEPFDLERGPLLRALLVRLDGEEWILAAVLHHIVADGWSMGLLVRELAAGYAGLEEGAAAPLPELPIQYGDFAAWQRAWLRGEVLERHLAYWRQRLAGAPEILELPTDRPRPPVQSFHGSRVRFLLDPALTPALTDLGRRHGATLFMVLLAAFQTLLARHSGQDDVVVGSPSAGRDRPETALLIGLFLNTLVLRTDLSGEPGFAALLGRVRETTLGADAHQDLPFERLVDSLGLERDLSRNPVYQVQIAFQNLPDPEIAASRLSFRRFGFDDETAQLDLSLYLLDTPRGLDGALEYRTELFDADTVARLAAHFGTLLQAAADGPERRISELPLLTPAERHQVLTGWNDTETDYGDEIPIHRLFERQADLAPKAVALVGEEERLTYRELNERANRLAHCLRGLGCGPETCAGVFMERSVEMVVALLAILKAGAAYLPLDPEYPADRIAHMLGDARAPVLLTQPHLAGALPAAAGALVLPLEAGETFAGWSGDNPRGAGLADHVAYVIYTSGSTGQPKGVAVPHRGIRNRLVWMQESYRLTPADRVLQKTPFSFDVSVWELFWPLLAGASLVMARPGGHRDSSYLAARIEEQGITVLHFVPSMLQAFLAEEGLAERCRSLRLVICSGEALPADLAQRCLALLPAELHNLYGPTEASVDITAWACEPGSLRRAVPIGRPIANIRILLLDRARQPVPIGVAGELHIGGVGLARCYLGRPGLTAERFVPDPFGGAGERLYRTGDLVRALRDGAIEFLGRLDHQVKVRGFRIELGEIESVLAEHPEVREAVVVACDDARTGGRRLVAYAVPAAGAAPSVDALRRALRERLPEHMVPSAFVLLDALPLSANGKVDRRALPAPDGGRPELEHAFVPPRTATEQQLAAIWEEVLGVERVGLRDNFFSLGGDSILSVQVLARARERGLGLDLQQIFQHQTVAELARAAAAGAAASPPLPPFALIGAEDRRRLPDGLVDAYPVTRLQAGMLFHSDFSPESAVYHDIFTSHLQGPFDEAALRGALARVTAAHPVLRTSFDLTGFTEPLQLVQATAEPDLRIADLWPLGEARQREELAAWLEEEKGRPFDWERAPLLRVCVHRRSGETFQFSLGFHHAILDGWSVSSLLTELFRTYLALCRGEEPGEPETVQGFGRFVALERDALRSPESARFWEGEVAAATVSALPRWPAAGGRRGSGFREADLPAALSERLRRLARSLGVPVKSALLAAHGRVLAALAGQAEVVTGVVASGRPEEEGVERSLGLFLNTVPLRLALDGCTWRQLVLRAFEAETAMLPHRWYPSVELQRLQGRPLFEAAFNYVHFHVYEEIEQLQEIRALDRYYFERTSFTFLASFNQNPFSGDLHLRLEYDPEAFPPEQIEAIAGLYERALEALAADSDSRQEATPLLSEAERHQLLLEWNDTRTGGRGDLGLHQLIELQVERSPQAPAATFEGTTVSYRELDRRANRLARRLLDLGCGPETRVGVVMERSLELMVALLGILKAGAAYVPLDPEYPQERLAFMLEDSRPAALLIQERLRGRLPASPVPIIALEEGFGADGGADRPAVPFEDRQLAYVIYTSGSTGRPKGAMVHHQGIRNRLLWMQEAYGLTPADVVLQKTPFSFDVSVWEFFWPLLAGARLVLARPGGHRDSDYLPGLIERERVSVLHFVPSMLQAFLEEPDLERCRSLRLVAASGEALPPELARRFAGRLDARLENLYGPTEASVDVTAQRYRPGDALLPIGRPIANTRIHLLDADLRLVPLGAPGELYIAGVNVGRGYLDRPGLTAERFLPDPWSPEPGARLYRTGDLARHLPAGEIEYLGRIDHQVKIRGFRIELGEIEAALAASPAVREAVVVAREDRGTRRLVAYLTPAPGAAPASDELRRLLLASLPEHMVPAAFVVLERLPLSPNGKLDRRALPAPEIEEAAARDYEAPRDTVERELAAIWSEVLRLDRVGVHDDFFALGGDSIVSLQVAARARQRGLRLSSREVFERPTIAELARGLDATPLAEGEPEAASGPVPLTPIQSWFFEQGRERPWHFNQAVLLELRERPEPGAFEQALATLLAHHDALRLRFEEGPEGWRQNLAEPGGPVPFTVVDLAALPAAVRREALEGAVAQAQASLDLSRGPLLRAVLAGCGDGGARLLLAVHHLAIDGVSWRILLDDLASAYARIARGEPAALPARTTSFKRWAERLAEHVRSGARDAEAAFWSAPERAWVAPLALPRRSPGNGTSGSARTVTVELPEAETAALLTEVPRAFHTQINDALLAALLLAYHRQTGEPALLIDLEGHGRENIARDLDPVRTVGWLTTLFPVPLVLPDGADTARALRETRERLRAIPDRGIGYGLLRHLAGGETAERLRRLPQAEVIFNYLGQLDSVLPADAPFVPAAEASGPSQDPDAPRPHAIEVGALVAGGRLQARWTYSGRTHRREDVERLAHGYLHALRDIVASSRSTAAGGYTPSDFPDIDLSQSRLDSLLAEIDADFDFEEIP